MRISGYKVEMSTLFVLSSSVDLVFQLDFFCGGKKKMCGNEGSE